MHANRTRNYVHYFFFACVMLEVLALEIFTVGEMRHLWNAVAVAIYAVSAARVANSRGVFWVVLLLGAAASVADLLDVRWTLLDVESLFWMLMHAALTLILGRRLFEIVEVSHIEIIDSVTLYLVTGIMFANVYAMVLWHDPGALLHTSVPAGERVGYDLVVYYSFITQATVGYGDMAPAHRLTRTISIGQAIFGVMYIAIMVSRFVSIHSAAHFSRHSSRD